MFQFLLLSLLLLPAFGQTVPDYDDPYSPIFTDKPVYSWTDKMKITIISPSWNSDTEGFTYNGVTMLRPLIERRQIQSFFWKSSAIPFIGENIPNNPSRIITG